MGGCPQIPGQGEGAMGTLRGVLRGRMGVAQMPRDVSPDSAPLLSEGPSHVGKMRAAANCFAFCLQGPSA